MTGYLISVIGVVILGVLVDIVLPSGQMNKYVKSMFGFFTVIVLISPLPKLLNSNFDLSNLFYNSQSIQVDSDFLIATNKKITRELESNVVVSCKNAGFDNIECKIESILEENRLKIIKVNMDLKKMVISQTKPHINKYAEIVQAVKQIVNVEEEQIIFNE
ncbi:MAG: stage III sporulation protein AF [Clostridiales bacterium]|nr:stage III sporulation protein AF [Candidatus Apopatousia equi]